MRAPPAIDCTARPSCSAIWTRMSGRAIRPHVVQVGIWVDYICVCVCNVYVDGCVPFDLCAREEAGSEIEIE